MYPHSLFWARNSLHLDCRYPVVELNFILIINLFYVNAVKSKNGNLLHINIKKCFIQYNTEKKNTKILTAI